MSTAHPRPFYYLENFQTALAWLQQRYEDLLNDEERRFMRAFANLPRPSSALLVRMIMRKGGLFRTSKLDYEEIGCPRAAATPLVELGWLDDQPLLGVAEIFSLLRKAEVASAFRLGARARAVPKAELMATLAATFVERRTFEAWCPAAVEVAYRVRVLDLCERLRLMFLAISTRRGRSSCLPISASSTTRKCTCRLRRARSSGASTSTTSMRSIAAASGSVAKSRARKSWPRCRGPSRTTRGSSRVGRGWYFTSGSDTRRTAISMQR